MTRMLLLYAIVTRVQPATPGGPAQRVWPALFIDAEDAAAVGYQLYAPVDVAQTMRREHGSDLANDWRQLEGRVIETRIYELRNRRITRTPVYAVDRVWTAANSARWPATPLVPGVH